MSIGGVNMIVYVLRYYLEVIADWVVCGMYADLDEARSVAAKLKAENVRYCLEWHEIY